MFCDVAGRSLVSMSQLEWSELGVSGLPTGTVTLLLADVEGSTRLWETQPEEMTAAIARLDDTLSDLVTAHGGMRPVEQGEGDSFVVAFARASDAVACRIAQCRRTSPTCTPSSASPHACSLLNRRPARPDRRDCNHAGTHSHLSVLRTPGQGGLMDFRLRSSLSPAAGAVDP